MHQFRALSILSSLAIFSSACAYDVGSEPDGLESADGSEVVGTSEEAFSGLSIATLGLAQSGSFDLGPATGRTCFLRGVGGQLGGYAPHHARVSLVNNRYTLDIATSTGSNMLGDSICMSPTTGATLEKTVTINSNGSPQPVVLGSVTAARRCFLTGVASGQGGFLDPTDTVKVWNDGRQWFLGGSAASGYVRGMARCIDITLDRGEWTTVVSPGATYTQNLSLNSNPGGVGCALTGVSGLFMANNWQGARISYNSSLLQWAVKVENSKGAWTQCAN